MRKSEENEGSCFRMGWKGGRGKWLDDSAALSFKIEPKRRQLTKPTMKMT